MRIEWEPAVILLLSQLRPYHVDLRIVAHWKKILQVLQLFKWTLKGMKRDVHR